jgi:hypothetical protein
MLDSSATKVSIAGYNQFLVLKYEDLTIILDTL